MNININIKSEKGITLVALGITIIVLLILAGVTTSNMDEMNSVVEQAQDTKDFVESMDVIESQEKVLTNSDALNYIIK